MKKEQKSINNKGFSLVELIVVIAIMAILIGVLAPNLVRYIETTNVSADTQLANSVRTAILTAMMDPTVINAVPSATEISATQIDDFSVTGGDELNTLDTSTSAFATLVWEILGVADEDALIARLRSATDPAGVTVQVEITGANQVRVTLEGTDASGRRGGGTWPTTVTPISVE